MTTSKTSEWKYFLLFQPVPRAFLKKNVLVESLNQNQYRPNRAEVSKGTNRGFSGFLTAELVDAAFYWLNANVENSIITTVEKTYYTDGYRYEGWKCNCESDAHRCSEQRHILSPWDWLHGTTLKTSNDKYCAIAIDTTCPVLTLDDLKSCVEKRVGVEVSSCSKAATRKTPAAYSVIVTFATNDAARKAVTTLDHTLDEGRWLMKVRMSEFLSQEAQPVAVGTSSSQLPEQTPLPQPPVTDEPPTPSILDEAPLARDSRG